MGKTVYGYVRVSTREQNEDRQMIAMSEYGILPDHIFLDKQSGKDFDRPGWCALLKTIRPGDRLVVKSIDRLGRNYAEIKEQWRIVTKEKGVSVKVLDMPLLDTNQELDLTGTLISDIVLELLGYVAETERDTIRKRQSEGIAAAKARGVRFGRLPKKRPDSFEKLRRQYERGEISARQAAKNLGISHSTFLTWIK